MVTLEHKIQLAEKFHENLKKYDSLVLIETTNMDNRLMSEIKTNLVSKFGGKFLHGKKRSFVKRCNDQDDPIFKKLGPKISGNVILYFHDNSCAKIVKETETYVRSGSAKYGQIAQVDYTIQPQQTKLSPENTKYFQKLRVPTKLTKGTLEITNYFNILEKGKIVTQMQIDVLSVMKILPYTFKPKVTAVFTHGENVDPEIYRIPADLITQISQSSITNSLALGFGASFPAKPVAVSKNSDVLSQAFALALELSDKVEPPKEFKEKIALLNNPEALAELQAAAASAAPASNATEAKVDAKKEEKAESSEEVSEMDLDF